MPKSLNVHEYDAIADGRMPARRGTEGGCPKRAVEDEISWM